jgi:glutamate:GABA antiporter
MFPHEGSLYNWTHKALGGYWSFFVAFCAWFPGVLLMVAGADTVVTYLQNLNPNWLTATWQQGVVVILLLIFCCIITLQPFRTVQNMANVMFGIILLAVIIVGVAGVAWFTKGHTSATSFSHPSDWWLTPTNFVVFGATTQAYLGIEVPMNMGGEIMGRKVISRHLLWGTVIVIVAYLITTFTLLAVEGTAAAGTLFSVVTVVDMGLNKFFGDITAMCVISFFLMAPVVYNYSYARLLLVGGIDKRLPMDVGRLNKHRIPANAIISQTVIAIVLAAIVFLVTPLFTQMGNPAELTNEVYNVMLAASTLVWAISTAFLFINLMIFYFRDRQAFRKQLIFPLPVLWVSIVFGVVACALSIVDTLVFSWVPQNQIDNSHWWYIIGGLTLVCIIVAAIGGMLASSEAAWQDLSK